MGVLAEIYRGLLALSDATYMYMHVTSIKQIIYLTHDVDER